MSKIRVFLADDHAVVREGLKMLINSQQDMEVIGEAGDGKEACKKAVELKPDVVVLDISMPNMNGIQTAEQLNRICPEIKVLVLTVHEDESYLRQLLKAGAEGYVLKRAAASELTQSIRAVHSGGIYIDPSLAEEVVHGYISDPSMEGNQSYSNLSDRETEVLQLIALGYTNKEVATQLCISVKTVETYKARILEKLNIHSRADIVRYALKKGWLKNGQ